VACEILDPSVRRPQYAHVCALGVMTKAPQAGMVKTRLVPPLTATEAADLNSCFLRDLAAVIQRASETTHRSTGVAVYTPVGAEHTYHKILPDKFLLISQRGHDFGERLRFAAEDLIKVGFESVCLINSDSPTIPAEFFSEATLALAEAGDRIVLGPSDDGGYYLIGLKQIHARLFAEIDWSTEKVLQQTIDRAREINMDVHLLPSWFDVDDSGTLQRLCKELLDQGTNGAAPATRDFICNLVAGAGRKRIWPNE
jgi:hypothetical protein